MKKDLLKPLLSESDKIELVDVTIAINDALESKVEPQPQFITVANEEFIDLCSQVNELLLRLEEEATYRKKINFLCSIEGVKFFGGFTYILLYITLVTLSWNLWEGEGRNKGTAPLLISLFGFGMGYCAVPPMLESISLYRRTSLQISMTEEDLKFLRQAAITLSLFIEPALKSELNGDQLELLKEMFQKKAESLQQNKLLDEELHLSFDPQDSSEVTSIINIIGDYAGFRERMHKDGSFEPSQARSARQAFLSAYHPKESRYSRLHQFFTKANQFKKPLAQHIFGYAGLSEIPETDENIHFKLANVRQR